MNRGSEIDDTSDSLDFGFDMQQILQHQTNKAAELRSRAPVFDEDEKFSYVPIQEMCRITNLPEEAILKFLKLNVFEGFNLSSTENDYYVIENAHILIKRHLQGGISSEDKPRGQVLDRSINTRANDFSTAEVCETPSQSYFDHQSALVLERIAEVQTLDRLLKSGKRRHLIQNSKCKGLNIEVSAKKSRLVVKGKDRAKAFRIVLISWSTKQSIQIDKLNKAIDQFLLIKKKLDRTPTKDEYNVHSFKVKTVGDVLNVHLEFNIKQNHGEGSDEWNVIKALIKNHLSRPIEVKLSNKIENIVLVEQPLSQMTKAIFKRYLYTFKESYGTHDKIVTRVKAAMNFCFQERLIGRDDVDHFHTINRINNERHVEFTDMDLKHLFSYLDQSEDSEFRTFMTMQSSGHFRTSQVMGMKYSDFDFNHSKVKVKPKNSNFIWIHLPTDICDMVKSRMELYRDSNEKVDFLFPSKTSSSGHKANFTRQWDALRVKLGFYTNDDANKIDYKYRLHDFRESLLGRLESLDDPTLAALLGHLSLHALKNYRTANTARVKDASELGYAKLQKIVEVAV